MMKRVLSLALLTLLSCEPLRAEERKYSVKHVPKSMSIKTKKERFFYLMLPAVNKVHNAWMVRYKRIKLHIETQTNLGEVEMLKKRFKAPTDEMLLQALKPHPKSIVLAQAALESSWGTSRFFTKAYNAFGMWSSDENEPRIAANEQRNRTRTIWLRKYENLDRSVWSYFFLMATSTKFKEFRELKMQTNDPFVLIQKLDKYAEIGEEYVKHIDSVIRHNNLTKYDRIKKKKHKQTPAVPKTALPAPQSSQTLPQTEMPKTQLNEVKNIEERKKSALQEEVTPSLDED